MRGERAGKVQCEARKIICVIAGYTTSTRRGVSRKEKYEVYCYRVYTERWEAGGKERATEDDQKGSAAEEREGKVGVSLLQYELKNER